MTVFVPLSKDDQTKDTPVVLGDWLLDHVIIPLNPKGEKAFRESFKDAFMAQEQKALFDLLLEQAPLVMKHAATPKDAAQPQTVLMGRPVGPVQEAESFFTVLLSFIAKLKAEEQAAAVASIMGVVCGGADLADLRLRVLMSLFNALPPSHPSRHAVFMSTVDYAAKHDMFETVAPYLQHLESWMADWSLSAADQRALYRSVSAALLKLSKASEAYRWQKKHLEAFAEADAKTLSDSETIDAVVDAARAAVSLPEVFHFDAILASPAVQHLKSTPKKAVVELLEIFTHKGLAEYLKFHGANAKLFTELKLNHEECLAKIRLLSLASLAQGKNELSLETVGQHLQLSAEEVENWVVRAIGHGLLDGRIDQLRRVVIVKSAMQREFGTQQWSELKQKLQGWTRNVEELMTILRSNKAAGAEQAAMLQQQ
eukprot:GDKI01015356.1.p1 GENE.GDKI01015356.1~~GDKI01015356.1.p1  ORF type:complete len:439 (+),score=200.95 GDKI01015356.1:38-1318(+)